MLLQSKIGCARFELERVLELTFAGENFCLADLFKRAV